MKLCCLCSEGGKYVYSFAHMLADLGKKGEWAHVACIQTERAKAQKEAEARGAAPSSVRAGFRLSQVRRSPHCTG